MNWREYRTEFHIGLTYGVSEATVCRTIKKIEDVLMKSGKFRLPGRKALQPSDTLIEVVLIDATEQPIERPKKATTTLQWQKEATHPKSAVDCEPERRKSSPQHLGVAGYLGIDKLHENSHIPVKKSKLHPLTEEQKAYNHQLSSERIFVENVIRKLKIFRILSERYRNRRKRFGLRFNLIAAIYNLELAIKN